MLNVITWIPFVLLIAGVVFTLFIDFTWASIQSNLPVIVGVIVSFIIEEILASRVKKEG